MKKELRKALALVLTFSLIFTLTLGATASDTSAFEDKEDKEEIETQELEEESEETVKSEEKEEPEDEEKIKEKSNKNKEEGKKENKAKESNKKEEQRETDKDDNKENEEQEKSNLAEDIRPTRHAKFPVPITRQNSMMSNGGSEGFIEVSKTAERHMELADKCRTFIVNLEITGEPPETPVDVVLVLDKSGSMNEKTPIPLAPSGSSGKKYFVRVGNSFNDYVEVKHHSGDIWKYGSGASTRYVRWEANGNDTGAGGRFASSPVGKPFYFEETRMEHAKQASINFAGKVLNEGASGSRVSVVEFSGPSTTNGNGAQSQAQTTANLTDNINTITNAINNIVAVGGTNTEAGFIQGREVIRNSNNPDSKKVVIMFTDGLPTASNGNRYAETTDINHVHVQRALTAGKSIFQGSAKIADLFTVGLLQGMNQTERNLALNILGQTQNKGFYEAPSAAELNEIFDKIASQINYFAKDAVVVDKIGDNFDLVPGTLPPGASYNPTTREITWNIGEMSATTSLSYVLKAKPEFEGGEAYTNEYAQLTYTDAFDNEGLNKTFPKPKVNVAEPLKVSLTDASITLGDSISLGTGTDPNGENHMSDIIGGDGDGTYTYEWRVKGSSEIISTDKHPEVSPEEDTEYELTVIDSNGCKALATMTVVVNENIGEISISKTIDNLDEMLSLDFFGIEDSSVFAETEFKIKVTGPNDYEKTITIKHGETKTLEELELGEYTVEEINIDNKFKLVEINPESFELSRENPEKEVEVKNRVNYHKYGIKKANENGEPLEGAKFELRSGDTVDTVSTDSDGIAWFKMLSPGQYTLRETKAPSGYKLDNREVTITIGSDGNISTDPELDKDESDERLLIIENKKAPELPQTGGIGTTVFTIIGITLMLGAYFLYKRKYE